MNLLPQGLRGPARVRAARPFFAIAVASVAAIVAGCGGSSGASSSGGTNGGSTTVVVMASSAANDQLTGFDGTVESLTLTDKAGKQVTVISSPVSDEFIHLNGNVEPLVTVSVPQDTYVSASATVSSMDPLCSQLYPGSLYIDQMVDTGGVTVNLPAPINVTGNAMGLVLNLDVSKSTPFQGACPDNLALVPPLGTVFDLTPITIAEAPTNSANGMMFGLRGIVQSVGSGGSSLTVNSLSPGASSSPLAWTVNLNNSTKLQGGLNASQLAAGAVVDMDAAVQQDGSFLATRVAMIDASVPNLSVEAGPLLLVGAAQPVVLFDGTYDEGYLSPYLGGATYFTFGNAEFETSGQIDNLANLPFNATFTPANMVAGQRALLSTQATSQTGGPNYTPSTKMTLLPQTIDGTITAISSQGDFTAYTVQLAPYDLFTNLAIQPGQTTLLSTPNAVVVYADSNTQMLNSGSLSTGILARFYGLVFNDSGTLRMDCAQVNDGVAE